MTVKLETEHHLEFLSLKGGCTGWSESIHVKMSHCWKSCHGSDKDNIYSAVPLKHNIVITWIWS